MVALDLKNGFYMFSMSNLIALGTIQGLLVSIYLLFLSYSARLLASFLILITINMCIAFYLNAGLFTADMTAVAFWNSINSYLLLGPLLYFYSISLISPERQYRKQDWVHFFPFTLYLLSSALFWLISDNSDHLIYLDSLTYWSEMEIVKRFSPQFILPALHFIAYMVSVSVIVLNYWKTLPNNSSKAVLYWLLQPLCLAYCMMGAMFLMLIYSSIQQITPTAFMFALTSLPTVIALFSVSILIKRFSAPEPNVITKKVTSSSLSTRATTSALSSKTALDAPSCHQIEQNLKQLMEKEHYYKSANLTQIKLAELLGVSRHQLSEYFSSYSNDNFHHYINNLRVSAVKQEIAKQANSEPLLSIAFNCGFSSKSSFNHVFKKYEGITPSQYRKQLHQGNN